MIICNVYGVSDWPETLDEEFLIFENKEFESDNAAIESARNCYHPKLKVIVREICTKAI